MSLQEFLHRLAEYMRSANVTYDEDGQVVIHTGMCVDQYGNVVELDLEEV